MSTLSSNESRLSESKGQSDGYEPMAQNRADMRKHSRTFVTLFYWAKFVGVNPLKLTKCNELEFSYLGMLYGCLLTAFGSYSYYNGISERSTVKLPGDSPIGLIVDVIAIVSGFLETTLAWMSFAFYQNRLKLVVESFSKARNISVKLGIPDDFEKRLRRLGLGLLIVNCLYISFMIFNDLSTTDYNEVHVFLRTSFAVIRQSALNIVTIFLWSFLTVKLKFRQLNDRVRSAMRNATDDEEIPRSTRDSR